MKNKTMLIALGTCLAATGFGQFDSGAQATPLLDASRLLPVPPTIMEGTVPANGYAVTNRYLMKDGKPWIPALGEIHYLRVPRRTWGDAIDRMVAGGIDIISVYDIWNHHEETEGKFDWTGARDLRAFLKVCKEKKVRVLLRVGPFVHAEARNGGLPDWLYTRGIPERSNDPTYLAFVARWYNEIGKQVKGMLVKDGGPIFGLQIENEYQASGAPWEPNVSINPEWASGSWSGVSHMENLRQLMLKAGLQAPIWTATAWDAAPIPKGVVPMHSCYPINFWSAPPEQAYAPKPDYLIANRWKFPGFATAHKVAYDPDKNPYMMAEMGVGMVATLQHRTYMPPEMSENVSRAIIGGGGNGLGYYMYRGGTQLTGQKGGYLNEGTLPRLNYDYQAPVGEYGDYHGSFHRLRPIHMTLNAIGEQLAPMTPVIPEGAEKRAPGDVSQLSVGLRSDGATGFLFVSNYQTGVKLNDFKDVSYDVRLRDKEIRVGPFDFAAGQTAIFPVNLSIGGYKVDFATAEPLILGSTCVFAEVPGTKPVFAIGRTITQAKLGVDNAITIGTAKVIVLSREDVRNIYPTKGGFALSSLPVINTAKGIDVEVEAEPGSVRLTSGKVVQVPAVSGHLDANITSIGNGVYRLQLPNKPAGFDDMVLTFDYIGDHAYLYDLDEMVADHYNFGDTWRIRLDRTRKPLWGKTLILRIGALAPKSFPAVYIKSRREQRGLQTNEPLKLESAKLTGLKVVHLEDN